MLVRFLVHGNSVSYFTVDALSLAAAIAAALHLSYRAVICCATQTQRHQVTRHNLADIRRAASLRNTSGVAVCGHRLAIMARW